MQGGLVINLLACIKSAKKQQFKKREAIYLYGKMPAEGQYQEAPQRPLVASLPTPVS